MAVQTKICGLKTPETVAAAVDGGAALVGFVFYPKSPRAVTPQQAAVLGRFVPAGIERVGLFVDEDDRTVRDTVATAKLTMVQLHGAKRRIGSGRSRSSASPGYQGGRYRGAGDLRKSAL